MTGAHLITNLRNSLRLRSDGTVDPCVLHLDQGAGKSHPARPDQDDREPPTSRDQLPQQPDQKMEALGQLTAGVAHDFNNLLMIILGNAGALRAAAEARGNGPDARRAIAIENAAQRGGRLAAQLLAFSRKQVLCPEAVSAYAVLSGMHDLLSRAAGEENQTRLLGDNDLWTCRVDPAQLESAVLNLAFNARDAMPSGGTITISCRNQHIITEQARQAGGMAGDYVRVDVSDTGTGIQPELLGRVFEPFFTTKPVGKGSGLGLAQVHGFAGQSGGWVELNSAVGRGTTVSLLLPRDPQSKAAARPSGADAPAQAAVGPSILLVEQDLGLRKKNAAMLRGAGYRVIEAGNASEANRWLVSDDPLHLLITRTSLPDKRSGIDLACTSRRLRADLSILLIADSPTDEHIQRLGSAGRCEFLFMPVQPSDVLRMTEVLLRDGGYSAEREDLHSELREHPASASTNSIPWHQRQPPCANPDQGYRRPSRPFIKVPKEKAVRLGVLPLKTLGSRYEEGFSLGLAEELTTAFSRFRWMSCISPVSVATLAGEAITDSTRWLELDLDYLLEGSFRQSGHDIRIVIRLINMQQAGEISWSKRFDCNLADVLKLQDQIASDIAAEVAPELLVLEGDTAASRPQVDPTSYGMMLRAIPAIYRLDQAGFRAAGPLLKKSLELDGSNAAAHSWLSHWYMLLVGQGWAKNPRQAAQQADEHARRAVMLDPGDARGLTVAGHVKAYLYKEAEQGLQLHERALGLNGNLALAWCYAGLANTYLGRHAQAIDQILHAQRLSPHDPHGFFYDMAMVIPLLLTGDYKTAVVTGRRARAAHPGLSSTLKGLICALGFTGQIDEATGLRHELKALEPNFSVQEAIRRSPLTRPEDLQHYADGLRLAGCDEQVRQLPFADYWRPLTRFWKSSGSRTD